LTRPQKEIDHMKELASINLSLRKDVIKGDKENLLSIFDDVERNKRTRILTHAEEDTPVKVLLGELGEADLKLGADMKEGKQKSLMTLFWYAERITPFEVKKKMKAGKSIPVRILITP
jgi:hypothetical protein